MTLSQLSALAAAWLADPNDDPDCILPLIEAIPALVRVAEAAKVLQEVPDGPQRFEAVREMRLALSALESVGR